MARRGLAGESATHFREASFDFSSELSEVLADMMSSVLAEISVS